MILKLTKLIVNYLYLLLNVNLLCIMLRTCNLLRIQQIMQVQDVLLIINELFNLALPLKPLKFLYHYRFSRVLALL